MKCLLINQQRLLRIIDNDIRKSALGIINWFVDEDNVLNILLSVRGINYVYRQYADDELHPELIYFITPEYEVIGFYEVEERDELEVYDGKDYFEVD